MMKRGFTLVETLLIMGIFAILASLGSINFFSTINQTNVGVTIDVLVADLRTAQNNAMSGKTVSGVAHPSWGIKFFENRYIIFAGPTYIEDAPGNYEVLIPEGVSLSTSFDSAQILFSKESGEVVSYNSSNDTITLTIGTTTKTIELNQLGAITNI